MKYCSLIILLLTTRLVAAPHSGALDVYVNPQADLLCTNCHSPAKQAYHQSAHAGSLDRFLSYENTPGYLQTMGETSEPKRWVGRCVRCHGTQTWHYPNRHGPNSPYVESVIDVGCESCHGNASGNNGWRSVHGNYLDAAGNEVDILAEDAARKAERLAESARRGLVTSRDTYRMTQVCLSCHLIDDEELLLAGHRGSLQGFSYSAWKAGSERHNFLLSRPKNAAMPSILYHNGFHDEESYDLASFVVSQWAEIGFLAAKMSDLSPGVLCQSLDQRLERRLLVVDDIVFEWEDFDFDVPYYYEQAYAAIVNLMEAENRNCGSPHLAESAAVLDQVGPMLLNELSDPSFAEQLQLVSDIRSDEVGSPRGDAFTEPFLWRYCQCEATEVMECGEPVVELNFFRRGQNGRPLGIHFSACSEANPQQTCEYSTYRYCPAN